MVIRVSRAVLMHAMPWTRSGSPPRGGLAVQRLPMARTDRFVRANGFNTLRTPNQTCCVDRALTAVNDQYWWFMIKPASSYHSQMVNGAMADGSVHAIKDTIDRRIWMALSTQAGSELVSAESY